MDKKENKWLRWVLIVLAAAAVVCVVGYFAFCYWVNASGSLLEGNELKPEEMDQGSAIVVDGAGRREGVFTLFIAVYRCDR